MAQSNWSLALILACMALVPFGAGATACGHGGKPAETPASSESASPVASESASTAAPAEAESASPTPAASVTASGTAPASPPSAGSTKASAKNDPSWASCHKTFKPKGKDKDVSKDVAALARTCAKATKMKQVGKTITGKQGDSQAPQTYPLKAKANHCYRVYAQAGDGIKDLNVTIKDSTGAVAGEDSSDSATAIVFDDGAVCFKEDDEAAVVVSIGSGSGAYAAQIWGD